MRMERMSLLHAGFCGGGLWFLSERRRWNNNVSKSYDALATELRRRPNSKEVCRAGEKFNEEVVDVMRCAAYSYLPVLEVPPKKVERPAGVLAARRRNEA